MFPFGGSIANSVKLFAVDDEDYDERKPHACRWKFGKALLVSTYRKRLDRLTSDVFC